MCRVNTAIAFGLLLSAVASGAQAQAWLTIALPDDAGSQVLPAGINGDNVIAGSYQRSDGNIVGFVRTPDGALSTFSAGDQARGITVAGINAKGSVAGTAVFSDHMSGFLRSPDGQVLTFFVGMSNQVEASCINDRDDIGGIYYAAKSVGYIRYADGTVAQFGSPDGSDLQVSAINNKRAVAGTWGDRNQYGFFRGRSGRFTSFDIPNARQISVAALSNDGVIVGSYDDSGDFSHGFIREADGTIQTLDAPGAGRRGETYATGMNEDGVIVGRYGDDQGHLHGYARSPNGDFVTLDDKDAQGQGTRIDAIGPDGKMMGFYFTSDFKAHVMRVNAAQTGF